MRSGRRASRAVPARRVRPGEFTPEAWRSSLLELLGDAAHAVAPS
ncbi:hypothetical protein [Actinoplanes sp. M2I2]|nr:hypothetical protein [Actinoplanes sp. M2I2]